MPSTTSYDRLRRKGRMNNVTRELTELGLLEGLEEVGIPTAELAYYSKHGQRIWSEPRGVAAGYLWPQFPIHRGQLPGLLHSAVIERLGSERVHPRAVASSRPSPSRATGVTSSTIGPLARATTWSRIRGRSTRFAWAKALTKIRSQARFPKARGFTVDQSSLRRAAPSQAPLTFDESSAKPP